MRPGRPIAMTSRFGVLVLFVGLGFFPGVHGPAVADEGGGLRVHAILADRVAQHDEALAGFREGVGQGGVELELRESRMGRLLTTGAAMDEATSWNPDIVLAIGSEAAQAARGLAGRTPVVFTMLFHARDQGLLDPPQGGTFVATGVEMTVDYAQQVETLKILAPGLKKVGVLYDESKTKAAVEEIGRVVEAAGLELRAVAVRNREEIPARLRALFGEVGAFLGIADTTVFEPAVARWILEEALSRGIPVLAFSPNYVKAGALAALYADYRSLGRQTADLAIRTWRRGEGPAPSVERAKEVHLAVNRRVADLIGVRIPESIVERAEHVYPESE